VSLSDSATAGRDCSAELDGRSRVAFTVRVMRRHGILAGERRCFPKWKKAACWLLPVLGGAVAFFVTTWTLDAWISLGWRRPIQDWMTAHRAGGLAGYFGLLYLRIPDFVLAMLGGAILGVLAWRRWWQSSLLYSGTMFGLPYLIMTIDGAIFILLESFGARFFFTSALQDLVVVPLASGSAWMASRPRCRRAARMASNLCVKCGYNLTGNVTGRCPECGADRERPATPLRQADP